MAYLGFFMPPVVLTIITWIWYFCSSASWYTYQSDWAFKPLLILHLAMPVFYLVALVVAVIRKKALMGHKPSRVFYIVASIIMIFITLFGLLAFLVFTSGA